MTEGLLTEFNSIYERKVFIANSKSYVVEYDKYLPLLSFKSRSRELTKKAESSRSIIAKFWKDTREQSSTF